MFGGTAWLTLRGIGQAVSPFSRFALGCARGSLWRARRSGGAAGYGWRMPAGVRRNQTSERGTALMS